MPEEQILVTDPEHAFVDQTDGTVVTGQHIVIDGASDKEAVTLSPWRERAALQPPTAACLARRHNRALKISAVATKIPHRLPAVLTRTESIRRHNCSNTGRHLNMVSL